ncbi:unnamed protein product [Spirodela intermedia]|uniref:Uncharacterized protein n=1 Tax=Spirodela intermedia TaxID=51605 RepID=A0ABN7E7T0_SPIIN|nr:unnamed protein product [Spirodela intermedia]
MAIGPRPCHIRMPILYPGLTLSTTTKQSVSFDSMPSNMQIPAKTFPFTDPCGGRYIYVHELPPRFNDDMLKECKRPQGPRSPLENIEGPMGMPNDLRDSISYLFFIRRKMPDRFPWQDRMRKLKRKWLFSFAGAPRPAVECDFGESKCHSPSSIMQMFQSSLFLLQPQGDSYTRQVNTMREEVINLIPTCVCRSRSRLETLKDAFDVSVDAIIDKVTKLRKDIIQGHNVSDLSKRTVGNMHCLMKDSGL